MREIIMPNDVVKHKPTGETWVVAGVNHQTGELIPMGYPFPSIAKTDDCEILERRYETESQSKEVIKALKKHGLLNFIDVRLIDGDAIIVDLLDRGIEGVQTSDDYAEFQQIVEDAPTVDAVPVVRCKECHYRSTDGDGVPVCVGAMAYVNTPDDWYCASGERKGGDE